MADDAPETNNPAPADTSAPAAAEPELVLDEPEAQIEPASDEQPEGQAPEDELEDFEADGKKGKVSKALKEFLMRQADYTRGKQEVAKQREANDAQSAQIAAQAQAFERHAGDIADLKAISKQLEVYQKATPEQWQQWSAQNRDETAAAWIHYQSLKDQGRAIFNRLQQQHTQWQLEKQSAETKHLEEGRKAIAAKVPGWSPKLEAELQTYAESVGFSKAEWARATKPEAVDTLRKAMLYDRLVAKQRAARQATEAAPVAVAAPVGGHRAPSTDLRNLAKSEDISGYAKARQKQMEARARRA